MGAASALTPARRDTVDAGLQTQGPAAIESADGEPGVASDGDTVTRVRRDRHGSARSV
jgi:hypothetical protein